MSTPESLDLRSARHDRSASKVPLVVVGAGPFGLAVAADARRHGIAVRLFGEPMGFWRRHMPAGMVLRSASDWHLDPQGELTIVRFLAARGLAPADVEPLRLSLYLQYVDWFIEQAGLEVDRRAVHLLRAVDEGYAVELGDETVLAENVVLAVGLQYFPRLPGELVAALPPGRWSHTCDFVDFADCAGREVVVVGGRQSAYEWSALLLESGAASVAVVHRHASPAFAAADWTWATALAARLPDDPQWFRRLSPRGQQDLVQRLWAEGRLKVEPWLERRLASPALRVLAGRTVAAAVEQPGGRLRVTLDDGTSLPADHVVLATGYAPDIRRVPFLAADGLLDRLKVRDGYPDLDPALMTSAPGLFVTGALATADFGPFFGFTLAARSAALVLGRAVRDRLDLTTA